RLRLPFVKHFLKTFFQPLGEAGKTGPRSRREVDVYENDAPTSITFFEEEYIFLYSTDFKCFYFD
ncbi:hypothetical protein, partial [Desulfovibrio inopinatus]|uniref:hypothetical protein n=1 Tax=Desulfovibrio inopinatus TaxID=102109 RepID=UPI00055580E6